MARDVPFTDESSEYADAILVACDHIASTRGAGNAGALLGALVSVQARIIAGIGDRNVRRATVRQLSELLASEIERNTGVRKIHLVNKARQN